MHTSRAARTIVVSCERSPHSARKVKVKACRKMRDHTLIMFCRLRRPLSGSVFIRCTSFSICQYVPYSYYTFIRGTQERMVEPEITYSVFLKLIIYLYATAVLNVHVNKDKKKRERKNVHILKP